MRENRFKKEERLCLKDKIDYLFKNGKAIFEPHIRLVWAFVHDDNLPPPAQSMFTVPKKVFKRAVKRNLLKRRMRESFRLHKSQFYEMVRNNNRKILIAFVYTSSEISDSKVIQEEISNLVKKMEGVICRMAN